MPTQTIDLEYRPHQWQQQVHDRAKRFTVVVAHRRFGKTFLAVATITHAALATKLPNSRYGYLAPYLKQAKGVAWDYLKRSNGKVPGTKINEGELSIETPNGSRISLYGGDNPEAMRGRYFDGIIIDEMADLKPDVWGSIIRPALADRKGWALFIGTPKGVNQFSELYQFALSGEARDWCAMMFRVDETNLISESELASARAVMSDAQYRQEFLCDFSAASDNVLITIDQVSAACARLVREQDCTGLARIIGVDVARFGDDRSVIQRRWGQWALEPLVFQGMNNMDLAARVANVIVQWEPDAVFIDAGRGEGVIDRLRQLGHSVVEVQFGGKPIDAHYGNKRVEMWDAMAKWLRDGGALPQTLDLKTDLCTPTYDFDSAGRMRLESKDSIKERGMRSSDLADALALTFAHPVAAPGLKGSRRAAVMLSDYNPHAMED